MTACRLCTVQVALFALVVAGCDAFVSTAQRIERAQSALESGNWGRAAIELQKAVQREPGNGAAWLLLARISLLSGEPVGAQADLDRAMKAGVKGRAVDALRVETWLAANRPQSLIDAISHGEVALPEPDRSIALARAYNTLRQPDRALAALTTVLAAHPDLTAARLARARALIMQGEPAQALKEDEAAMAEDPASADAALLKGEILAQRGQYAAAEDAMGLARRRMSGTTPVGERALALAVITEAQLAHGRIAAAARSQTALAALVPDAPVARLLGARIKLAHGDYLNGIAQLQSIAAASPEFLPARMALGVAQLSQGNLMQAQAELAQVVQRAPDNLEARKLLARVRLQLDQPEEALRVLTPALDANAADPQLYALLAAASSRLGESDSTVEALEHGVRVHPSDRTLKLSLARAYLVSGRAKQALELLAPGAAGAPDPPRDALFVAAVDAVRGPRAAQDQVEEFLAARPKDPATLNLAAAFFTTQWQYGRAHALLDAALAANGHDVLTLTNLARVDLATGNAAGAENALRTALTYDEHNVALRIALAHLAMRRGEFAQAEQLLQAGGGAAASPQLQFAIAQLRLARGDLAQASAELDGALASQPRRPDLVNEAGIVLMAGREYAAALARFRRATELAPDEARYWLNSGRAQLALDEPTAARESFEGALKLKPGWTPAVAALCLIDVREKRYDAALARVGQLLARRPNDPDALVLQGDVQAAAGRLELAAAAYTDAQRRRPSASVAVKLYQIRRAAKLPAPEGPLQQWLAAQPNDYRVRSVLGNFYLEQKLLPQCAREFETVVQQVPADVLALNNLAWTYEQLHDPRAEPIAERAYQLAPASAAVADTLGWILASRHATDRALPLLEKAARAASENLELQYHYAYVLAQTGKGTEAREILSRVLATKRNFNGRSAAERLLADLGA